MLLSACGGDTKVVFQKTRIPESYLVAGAPGIVNDPAKATQADVAQAYTDTYLAWEGCAVNLSYISSVLDQEKQ